MNSWKVNPLRYYLLTDKIVAVSQAYSKLSFYTGQTLLYAILSDVLRPGLDDQLLLCRGSEDPPGSLPLASSGISRGSRKLPLVLDLDHTDHRPRAFSWPH